MSALALLTAGCLAWNVSEDNYPERFGTASCDQLRRCYRGFYENEYSDHPDCIETQTELFEEVADGAELLGCDFEQEKAAECLATFPAISCEEWYEFNLGEFGSAEACTEVYDCF